jgi:hypothetical protein
MIGLASDRVGILEGLINKVLNNLEAQQVRIHPSTTLLLLACRLVLDPWVGDNWWSWCKDWSRNYHVEAKRSSSCIRFGADSRSHKQSKVLQMWEA